MFLHGIAFRQMSSVILQNIHEDLLYGVLTFTGWLAYPVKIPTFEATTPAVFPGESQFSIPSESCFRASKVRRQASPGAGAKSRAMPEHRFATCAANGNPCRCTSGMESRWPHSLQSCAPFRIRATFCARISPVQRHMLATHTLESPEGAGQKRSRQVVPPLQGFRIGDSIPRALPHCHLVKRMTIVLCVQSDCDFVSGWGCNPTFLPIASSKLCAHGSPMPAFWRGIAPRPAPLPASANCLLLASCC